MQQHPNQFSDDITDDTANYAQIAATFPQRLSAWVLDNILLTMISGFVFSYFYPDSLLQLQALLKPYVESQIAIDDSTLQQINQIMMLLLRSIFVTGLIYHVGFWLKFLQTPGQMVAGIQLLNPNGEAPKPLALVWRFVLRFVLNQLLFIPYVLSCLWLLLDRRRQTGHDKLCGMLVVDKKSWQAYQQQTSDGSDAIDKMRF